jgi:hypothetical protein
VARTAIVIGGIVVIRDIDNRVGFNLQLTILQESGLLQPGIYLHIATYINRPTPGVIAQRTLHKLIHLDFLATNCHALRL